LAERYSITTKSLQTKLGKKCSNMRQGSKNPVKKEKKESLEQILEKQ
jgi:hypothetical protein